MKRLIALLVVSLPWACPCPLAHAGPSQFGIESVEASLSSTQAGDHPDFTTTLVMKTDEKTLPFGAPRDITIDLPPGLTGNPTTIPQCDASQLTTSVNGTEVFESCPQESQVGVTTVVLAGSSGGIFAKVTEPIFNMRPPENERTVARLGFIAALFPTFIDLHVRSSDDYGVTATLEGLSAQAPLISATTTIWGVPASSSHDTERITPREAWEEVTETAPRPSGLDPVPFLTNPTSCGRQQAVAFAADSYEQPGVLSTATAPLPEIGGCGKLSFDPSLTVTPSARQAAVPTGLDVDLAIPQDESAGGLATSQLRDAVVTLPRGMSVAPGAANGLVACSAEQVGLGKLSAANCPAASKIGSVDVDAPALARPVDGSIFQRSPEPGDLFRIWLVIDELGVHVKLAGQVHLDADTGQITSVFVDNPQIPVRDLKLHLFGGPHAPLANPLSCAQYATEFRFTPWSESGLSSGTTPMSIDEGCETGGFAPKLSAGATSPNAGSFSPFVVNVTQETGEQNLLGLDVTLVPGVTAKLAGIPLCEDVLAGMGDCPPTSQIGSISVATGPGSAPLWLPQPGKAATAVYLAGRYRSAPLSLVFVVPAQAGPFDLGTVVSRAALDVDTETAQATAASDPLPQILEGVPVSYRHLHVAIDRHDFMLNPTSCDPMEIDGTARSAAQRTVGLTSRFQVGGCRGLGFKPRLELRLIGKTHRGANPGLRAVLRPRAGDTNIARAEVTLPNSIFLEQAHIGTVCTRVQFAADSCPRRSIYGYAKAYTPLLDHPLQGPVYLRSSSHELPDLVAALHGEISVDLSGRIDSVDGGLRTRFESAPDAPVTRFVLSMEGGGKGLLANSRNLCASPLRALVRFSGHNGRRDVMHPELRTVCHVGGAAHHSVNNSTGRMNDHFP